MLRTSTIVCCFVMASMASADVVVLEPVQVGGFYAGGAPPDNLPSFQNYYVGYGSLTGGARTPERRSFLHFDLSGISGDVVSATLELKLIPGGLIFGKGPGTPPDPIPSDTFEEFQLGGIFDPGLPVSKFTSTMLTPPEITGIFGAMDDAPIAPPLGFTMGGPPPPDPIVITLGAAGLTLLEMKAGGDVVLTGWMPTWSFDSRMFMGGFVEGSELIFGGTDVHLSNFPKPLLTITTAVPEASSGILIGAVGMIAGCYWIRRQSRRRLALLLVSILIAVQSTSAVADSRLYFTDPGQSDQVSRVNLDGSAFDVVVAFPAIVDPRALAIDGVNGKAYYSSGSVLQRVNFDGSGLESLGPSGGSVPTDITLDVSADKMYWSVDGTAGIKRSTLGGAGAVTLVSQSILNSLVGVDPLVRADAVSGIALDIEGGRLFWANGRHLNSMPLSGVGSAGDAMHQFELSGTGDINKIKLDLDNGHVYWTNNTGSVVQRAGLTGLGQTTLVTRGFGRPAGLAVDLTGDKLYFGDTLGVGGRGEILSANLDGSDALVIYPSGSSLFSPLDLEFGPDVATPEFLEADFEEDHDVDGADLESWKDNFGLSALATHMQGDANADGDVDGDDFLVWQRQLDVAATVAANAAVPEPASILLLVLGFLAVSFRRRVAVS